MNLEKGKVRSCFWGGHMLTHIRAGEIELWLHSLPLARSTCAKIILPKIPTSRLKGVIPKLSKPVSLEEIDTAIEAGATQRFRQKK